MKTFARTIKRSAAALALVGAVSAAALGSGVAHAGPAPQISVQVQQYASVVQVTGAGFGIGDTVDVVVMNNDGQAIVTSALTTASYKPIRCMIHVTCLNGFISVSTPPVYIHCGNDFVSVYAVDDDTDAVSNVVQARLGLGPC